GILVQGLKPANYQIVDGMTEVIPCYVWIVDTESRSKFPIRDISTNPRHEFTRFWPGRSCFRKSSPLLRRPGDAATGRHCRSCSSLHADAPLMRVSAFAPGLLFSSGPFFPPRIRSFETP